MKVYGALEVMERFKGQAGFSWIEEVSAHLRVSLNMGKNPEISSTLMVLTILGMALVESAAIYWLVVAFDLLWA